MLASNNDSKIQINNNNSSRNNALVSGRAFNLCESDRKCVQLALPVSATVAAELLVPSRKRWNN